MEAVDLIIAADWEYDRDFIALVERASLREGLTACTVWPDDLTGALRGLETGRLEGRFLFDRASSTSPEFLALQKLLALRNAEILDPIHDLRWAKLDAYIGSLAAGLIAFFIIVACGATLYPNGIRVETAKDAALALEPFAGHYATILFAFGLLNASVFSAAILPLSTAYAVCEAFGWETGVDRRPKEAPGFFTIFTLMILVGAVPILLPQAPLVAIMFWSQTLNGLLLPLVLLVMLKLINDPGLMGRHVNSVAFNLVAWGTAAVMIALSALLLVTGLV